MVFFFFLFLGRDCGRTPPAPSLHPRFHCPCILIIYIIKSIITLPMSSFFFSFSGEGGGVYARYRPKGLDRRADMDLQWYFPETSSYDIFKLSDDSTLLFLCLNEVRIILHSLIFIFSFKHKKDFLFKKKLLTCS